MNRLRTPILIIGSCFLLNGVANSQQSPETASQPEIERGREIYQKHCQECHGAEGRGDGPRAAMLAPRPGNLVSAATSAKTDEELLDILARGVPRTAMEGWSDKLSDDEQRLVLAYIRSFIQFQPHPSAPPIR